MKYPLYIGVAIGLSIGLLIRLPLEWLARSHTAIETTTNDSKQIRSGEGRFTNPLLECELGADTIAREKINFSDELSSHIEKLEKTPGISLIAAYFRDLNNGPTFGTNQESPFVPASLLKVPIMMAYYKLSESNPGILDEKLPFTKEVGIEVMSLVPDDKKLVIGNSYTIDDLIERMITYSDNEALLTLFYKLPKEEHVNVYQLAGIPDSTITNPAAEISVKQYAAFFRILFNSSFLNQANSEKALALLTKSTFIEGLRKGVNKNVDISHKFGERKINTGEQQLHDCGILYFPNKPILLCVMTRGKDSKVLSKAIADIATFVESKIVEM